MSCCGALAMLRPPAEPWAAVMHARARALDTSGMVRLTGGAFLMGHEGPDTCPAELFDELFAPGAH